MTQRPPATNGSRSRRLALVAGIPAALAVAIAVAATGAVLTRGTTEAGSRSGAVAAEGVGAEGTGAEAIDVAPSPSAPPSIAARSHPPSPTPSRSPRGGSCALPRYPKPSCTGVPPGTALTKLPLTIDNDSYAVTTPGAVIDRKHIPGNLLVWADNVTIRNTQIDGTVYNDHDGKLHPYTITDSTVGLSSKCITAPGLLYANYTARRVKVLGHDDGFRASTPARVRIYDSYAKLCWNPPSLAPPDGSHSGGIQAECGEGVCYNSEFIHNTIDNRGPKGNSGMTWMSFSGNPTSGWKANDNLVMGGTYTMIFWWTQGPDYEVHNNRVVDGEWAYGPADTRGSCAHQNWSGNTIVKINANYDVTSTVKPLACVN
jgi:hypothetical protein